MIATYVPAQLTPLDRDTAVLAIKGTLGRETSIEACALACAQSALESGRWKKMYSFSFGNVKAGETYKGQYTARLCNENIPGRGLVWFAPEGELTGNPAKGGRLVGTPLPVPPGHPQTRFRAYAGPTDGAYSYIDFLASRMPAAFQAMLTGSPSYFVGELKKKGYFTADEAEYLKGISSLQREFIAVIDGQLDVPETAIDPELERLLAYADSFLFEPIDNDPTPAVV